MIVDLVRILLGIWTLDDRSEIMGLHHLFIVLETGLGLGFQLFRVFFSPFPHYFIFFLPFWRNFGYFWRKRGFYGLLEAF